MVKHPTLALEEGVTTTMVSMETRAATDLDPDWKAFEAEARQALSVYAGRLGAEVEDAEPEPGEAFRFLLAPIPFPDGIGSGWVEVSAYRFRSRPHLSVRLDSDRVWEGYGQNPERGRVRENSYFFCRSYDVGGRPGESEYRAAIQGIERARHGLERLRAERVKKGTTLHFLNTRITTSPQLRRKTG